MKTDALAKRICALVAAATILLGVLPLAALAQPAVPEPQAQEEAELQRELEARADKIAGLALSSLEEGEGPAEAVRNAFCALDADDEHSNEVMVLVLDILGDKHLELVCPEAERAWSMVELEGAWYHLDVEENLLLVSDDDVVRSIEEQAAQERTELPAAWAVAADAEDSEAPELPEAPEAYVFTPEESDMQTASEVSGSLASEGEAEAEEEAPAADGSAVEAEAFIAGEAEEGRFEGELSSGENSDANCVGVPETEPALVPASAISTIGNPADYPANALGFYQWLGDAEAAAVFSEKVRTAYGDIAQTATTLGGRYDSTHLTNMKIALELIPVGNRLRMHDDHFPGRGALTVNSQLMAVAQVHTNWAASYFVRTKELAHPEAYTQANVSSISTYGENLAAGYGSRNPYDGWYTDEKRYWEIFGSTMAGHYLNLMSSSFDSTGFAYNSTYHYFHAGFHGQFFGRTISGKTYSYSDYYAAFMRFYEAHRKDLSVPMYRLYNPNSGEHFYTASTVERDALSGAGWHYEGIGWYAPEESGTPVYRFYSGTDHHYTTSHAEFESLLLAGWFYEGVGWYSDDAKTTPLYRQFNPNVNPRAPRNNSGSHNYTMSKTENDYLVSVGWNAEGVGWYGM